MIQGCVHLVAVARAKLKKECVPDGLVGQLQDFTLDFPRKEQVSLSGCCNAKAGRLEFNKAILECKVKDFQLNLCLG